MKLLTNYYKNQWQQVLLSISLLAPLLIQPLAAQSFPSNNNNEQISQNTNQSAGIAYRRVGIGGVNLSMSEAQVRKVLGNPIKQKNGYEAIAGKTRTLQYSGITVDLLENVEETGKFSVYKIETNSSKYPTVDGVKVGDSLSKLIATYGKPDNGNLNTLSYTVNSESPVYFMFTFHKNGIKKISCGDFLG